MEYTSLTFLLFVSSVVFLFLLNSNNVYRHTLLSAANALFIVSYTSSVHQLIPLILFLTLGYGMIEAVRRAPSQFMLTSGIIGVLAVFVFMKNYGSNHEALGIKFPYLVIGVSYILFRMLQIMIDAASGELNESIKPWVFFNYTCNFLCFLSGPIQRYQDFTATYNQPVEGLNQKETYDCFTRIVKGYAKLMVISGIANYMFLNLSAGIFAPHIELTHVRIIGMYAAASIVYTIYLYANFSGYMDISLGIGALLGQKLPENFNKPFLASNFLDFWSRWHMTLSNWFKTYLFNPLLKKLVLTYPSRKAEPYLGAIAFFITFMIMGMWHGSTAVFAVYGLAMGFGACATKFWQIFINKALGKKTYKEISSRKISVYAGRGLTTSYFAMALTCFWVDWAQLSSLWNMLGAIGLSTAFIGLAVIAALGMFVWDIVLVRFTKIIPSLKAHTEGLITRNLLLALRVLIILTVSSLFNKAPEFVYRAF